MMDRILEKPIIPVIILILAASYLFIFRLGDFALTDPDETFYAQTAKEMLQNKEWLTPYLYGQPQFEKPILFYWFVEASFRVFGVNEFAARLPSAVFGLFGLLAVYLLGNLLFTKRVGFFAALILATNVEYIMLARACITDMVLSTLMLFGVLFFFYGYIREKGYFYMLSSAAFAFATMTKGPIAIVLPVFILVLYLFMVKDLKVLKNNISAIFISILLFLAISLPWYLVMYKVHGKNFVDVFFGFHNITRFLEPEHKIGSQFYYYIPIILGGFFPWSVFLPVGLWHAFKKVRSEKRGLIFLLTWLAVIVTFFSVSRTKLPTYVFPAFVSLAFITAILWDDYLKGNAPRFVVNGMKFSYYLLLAAVVFGMAGLYIFLNTRYPIILKPACISGAFLAFGIILSFTAFVNKKGLAALILIFYSVAIFLYPFARLVLPELEPYEASKDVSLKLKTLMEGDDNLGAESNYIPGIAFYTDKFPINFDDHDKLVKSLESDKRIWGILKEKNHIQLHTLDTKVKCWVPTYMVYKVGKRCIITNKIPRDGKYIIKRERSR